MNNKPDPRDELVDHLPALRAFAMSLTRNSAMADDLVQDTIEKAWKNIKSFTPGTNLRAWLFTIQRNAFYSSRRQPTRAFTLFLESLRQGPVERVAPAASSGPST